MAKKPNVLFFLIDALRYDTVANARAMRALTPAISSVAERGFTRRVVANAQSTQFVLPSLFSLNYPLDHGGYNNGIQDRPASFVECLRDAGYSTELVGACNQMGISLSYDRGFNAVYSAVDFRHLVRYRIEKTLYYELALADEGKRTEAESQAAIKEDMSRLLSSIIHCAARSADKQ